MIRGGDLTFAPHIVTLANFLAAQGVHLTLACYGANARPQTLAPQIRFVSIAGGNKGGSALSVASIVRGLSHCLRQEQFDICYAIDSWTLPYLWLALRGKPGGGARRLVYHTFEWLEPGLQSSLRIRLERWFARAADLVVTVDRTRGRLMQTLYSLPVSPMCVRNSLLRDTPVTEGDPLLRTSLLGPDAPEPSILMVYPSQASASRLTLELVLAFALLPERYRLVTFASSEDEYVRECREVVRMRQLQDRVHLVPMVPHSEVMSYLACADIGAILHDGRLSAGNFMAAPQRLSDYAVHGIPVVASDYPNMEALIYRYGLGRCADPFQPQRLADAILALVERDASIESRRAHIHRVFREELCFDIQGLQLLSALQQLAGVPDQVMEPVEV